MSLDLVYVLDFRYSFATALRFKFFPQMISFKNNLYEIILMLSAQPFVNSYLWESSYTRCRKTRFPHLNRGSETLSTCGKSETNQLKKNQTNKQKKKPTKQQKQTNKQTNQTKPNQKNNNKEPKMSKQWLYISCVVTVFWLVCSSFPKQKSSTSNDVPIK